MAVHSGPYAVAAGGIHRHAAVNGQVFDVAHCGTGDDIHDRTVGHFLHGDVADGKPVRQDLPVVSVVQQLDDAVGSNAYPEHNAAGEADATVAAAGSESVHGDGSWLL